jgi:hypothetical protein
MQATGAITIYHLSRRDGTALFIHPFIKRGSMLDLGGEFELVGRYGREPRVESVTMLRNELYRRIDTDVRDWINERRFIPRFLISAGVFLVVYLFLAAVVRDPLPVLDETLIGLAVAAVTFIVVGRRFEQSRVAAQRRVALRSKVDGVVFSESPFVRELEDLLQQLEELDPTVRGFPDSTHERARELWSRYHPETAEVVSHLRHIVGNPPYKELARQMKKGRLNTQIRDEVKQGTLLPAAVHLVYVLSDTS